MLDITDMVKVKAYNTMADVLQSGETTFRKLELILDTLYEADEIIKKLEERQNG